MGTKVGRGEPAMADTLRARRFAILLLMAMSIATALPGCQAGPVQPQSPSEQKRATEVGTENSSARQVQSWNGEVACWGTLREVLHEGKTEGRISLSADHIGAHTIGVGALEDLAGEVTIVDGRIYLSRVLTSQGPSDRIVTTPVAANGDKASLLVAASVKKWESIVLDRDIPASAFDDFIAAAIEKAGLAGYPVVPFEIRGTIEQIDLHVVSGRCPHASATADTPQSRPPATATRNNVTGTLVGFFAASAQGHITHHDSRTHVHAVLQTATPTETLAGHVDSVALRAGSTLALPAIGPPQR